jgi:hypothetical protein
MRRFHILEGGGGLGEGAAGSERAAADLEKVVAVQLVASTLAPRCRRALRF